MWTAKNPFDEVDPAPDPPSFEPPAATPVTVAELQEAVLSRLAGGRSMPELVGESDLMEWLTEPQHAEFRDKLRKAEAVRAYVDGENLRHLVMNLSIPTDRVKAIVSAMQWLMARADPSRFGDKVQVDISLEASIRKMDDKTLDIEILKLLPPIQPNQPNQPNQ